jgi:hypothetical protein
MTDAEPEESRESFVQRWINALSLYAKEKSMPQFTDPQVVSAFNTCFDLEKWRALPTAVRDRAERLFTNHRIKMCCWFDQDGFALRVFCDRLNLTAPADRIPSGDTVKLGEGSLPNKVDLDARFLKCPAGDFAVKEEWLVKDDRGEQFLVADEDEDSEGEYLWSSLKREAVVFDSRDDANTAACKMNGVVVKK